MMNANEFYRKRIVELSKSKIMKRLNEVVNIDVESQICQEYYEYKTNFNNRLNINETLLNFDFKLCEIQPNPNGFTSPVKLYKYKNIYITISENAFILHMDSIEVPNYVIWINNDQLNNVLSSMF